MIVSWPISRWRLVREQLAARADTAEPGDAEADEAARMVVDLDEALAGETHARPCLSCRMTAHQHCSGGDCGCGCRAAAAAAAPAPPAPPAPAKPERTPCTGTTEPAGKPCPYVARPGDTLCGTHRRKAERAAVDHPAPVAERSKKTAPSITPAPRFEEPSIDDLDSIQEEDAPLRPRRRWNRMPALRPDRPPPPIPAGTDDPARSGRGEAARRAVPVAKGRSQRGMVGF